MKTNILQRILGGAYNFVSISYPNLLILTIFFVLSLIGILHHEIWLDEAQHFLIARDSRTLSELFHVSRNEGHPILWNIILFIITRFSSNLFYMQFVHILISCITVAVILKSNLSLVEKILIIFGYYFLYEYNVISRNYGISALIMILLAYYYSKDKGALIKLAIVIFILAQTHLFSLLFSIAFVVTYIVNERASLLKQNKRILITAVLIVWAGWLISAYFIIPPWQYGMKFISYDSSGYFSTERIVKTLSVGLKGIFYIPDYHTPDHQFINTLYYLTLNLKIWKIYLLSIAAIVIPAVIVKNNRFALVLFCSYFLIFITLYFFLPLVYGIRYFGFFYIVFICCYLIARPKVSKAGIFLSIIIFALQFINGVYAYSMDFRHPFSEAKNVSSYLEKVKLNNERVFILNATLRPSISAYTGEKYFGTENGQFLTYCHWDESLPDSVLKSKLNNELIIDSTSLIISNTAINNLIDTTKLQRLVSFSNGIFKGENAVVYRYRR